MLVRANDDEVWAFNKQCKSMKEKMMVECWRRLGVDFAWLSKVLNLLKVVHMIREMG